MSLRRGELPVDSLLQVALVIFSAVSLATLEFIRNAFPNTDLVRPSKTTVVYLIILVQVLPAVALIAADRFIAARYGHGRRLRIFRSVIFAAALVLILRQLQLYWDPAKDFADEVRSTSLALLAFVDLLIVAAIVAACVWAFRGLALFFYYMSPVAVAMSAIIVFQVPTGGNLPEAYAQDVTSASGESQPPVFVLVFDELGYNVLLEEDGKIEGEPYPREGKLDAENFPNIASLAEDGIWFTNATTYSLNSLAAVPKFIDPARSLSGEFDVRLYTQYLDLEERYYDDCGKLMTCRGVGYLMENNQLRLASNIALRAFYQATPKPIEDAIDRPMGWFLDRVGWAYPPADPPGLHTFTKRQFDLFLDDIKDPDAFGRIYVLHLLLPHVPFAFDPDGNAVNTSSPIWGDATGPKNYRDQAMYVDRLVGEFVDKLKREGIYDESVIFMSGDHGPKMFTPSPRRPPANFMPRVPLIIHAPGLSSQVSSVDFQHIDFGATLADVLGMPPLDDSEGVSALSEERPQREKAVRVNNLTFVFSQDHESWQLWPPDGLLFKGSDGSVYLSQGGLKRHVPNAVSLEAYGYQLADVETITDSKLNGIPSGTPLLDVLADGNLLRGSGGEIYVMEAGEKRRLTSVSVMNSCNYGEDAVYEVTDTLLADIPSGVGLSGPPCPYLSPAEGTLARGSDDLLYVIDGGLKRHIAGPSVLAECGYLVGDVNVIADSYLASIPKGDEVTGKPCP